jgi:tetratricopeptide (TPR) repeat protein
VVARLDAWLKVPIPVAELRARFGKAALQQTRKDGRQEELFFPRLTGFITPKDQPDLAVAISYLSARALSDALCEQSQQFNHEQRYAESGEPADNAVRVDPDYARAYLVQGIHHYYQRDFNEAMVSFVAATHAKYPPQKIAHAHVWLGTLYWHKKMQPKKAREEFNIALSIAPDFGTAYLEYGRFLKAQREVDAAIDAFAKATQLDQAPHEARMELAKIHFERKEWTKTLPYLVQLADWADKGGKSAANQALSVANIYALYGYTLSAIRGKRNELLGDDGSSTKIVAAYEKSISLNPKVPSWVFEELGHEYFDDADLGRAEASYRKGLALEPKHLGLNQKLADTLLAAQHYEEARRQAEFALSLEPKDTWQMMNIARANALLGKRQDAMAWLRKAGAAGYQAQYIGGLMLEDGIFENFISDDELQRLLPGRR